MTTLFEQAIEKCPVQQKGSFNRKTASTVKVNKLELLMPNYKSGCTWAPGKDIKSSPHYTETNINPPPVMDNILGAVGNTPMVRINNLSKNAGLKCDLYAKCEDFNAGGSLKVRISLRMIEEAERKGLIKPGITTLIEPSSGNTGIGMALAASVKGYKCTIVMSEKMSSEKEDVIKALGAEMVRTPAVASIDSPDNHIAVAKRLEKEIPNSIVLNQYCNASNPMVHYDTTAEEILHQMGGKLDMIVIGAGTGGTVTGIGRKLKERCPQCIVVAVDPEGSIQAKPAALNSGGPGFFEVEGIGHNFIPTTLDHGAVDRWYKVSDKETFNMARSIIKEEGLLTGGSSGSMMAVALRAAKELKEGQKCVVILPDGVRNYMTKFLSDKWMIQKGFMDVPEDISSKHWWWNEKISNLDIRETMTLLPSVSCQKAVDIMKREHIDNLPVTDQTGNIMGIVTISTIMRKLVQNGISAMSPVEQVMNKSFFKATLDTTLGKLSTLLDCTDFVVVVHYQKQQVSENGNMAKRELIIGVMSHIDLVDFITARSPPESVNSSDSENVEK